MSGRIRLRARRRDTTPENSGAAPTARRPAGAEGTLSGSRAGRELADFTITRRSWRVMVLSLAAGAVAAAVALALLDLIGLFTHLLYYQDVGVSLVQPTLRHLGPASVLVPIAGGLVIGAMAYWGSERIRGHGIPEAMETILVGGSKVEPRLAVLKPISSAISIGSGGPFGAEGPIILTGGAFGSVLAQFFHLSASERRTLLVAGACAGMAAVFGTPLAAILFGVELLVFEWKPRSMVPIALAVSVAETIRGVLAAHGLVHPVPLFPVPATGASSGLDVAGAAVVGLASGLLAWVLTTAVYGAEDLFKRLPFHWAWWPAIGGAVIGIGGLIEPAALGVGYASIGAELAGRIAVAGLAALLVVKLVIWSVGLGSGTSGGILAPLLIMGAALGGIMAPLMPGGTPGTWALLGMAGALAGVTRSPLTAITFAFELTHDISWLVPLIVTSAVAHLISTLILRRSILTEKVARKGFHVVREYQVEPLEALYVREAMRDEVITVPPTAPVRDLATLLAAGPSSRWQRLYPVVSAGGALMGALTRADLARAVHDDGGGQGGQDGPGGLRVIDIARLDVVVAHPDETLREAADRMAEHLRGTLPVVSPGDRRLLGMLSEFDLLKARQRQLAEERHRERVLTVRWLWPAVGGPWARRPDAQRAAPGGVRRPGPG